MWKPYPEGGQVGGQPVQIYQNRLDISLSEHLTPRASLSMNYRVSSAFEDIAQHDARLGITAYHQDPCH
jgi:hypothetical protein